jgi:hypothetical protein
MLTALSVLSQHYDDVLKPDAERAATTIKAKAFAAASKSVTAESPARQGGGNHSSPPGSRGRWRCHVSNVSGVQTYVFKCFHPDVTYVAIVIYAYCKRMF